MQPYDHPPTILAKGQELKTSPFLPLQKIAEQMQPYDHSPACQLDMQLKSV